MTKNSFVSMAEACEIECAWACANTATPIYGSDTSYNE